MGVKILKVELFFMDPLLFVPLSPFLTTLLLLTPLVRPCKVDVTRRNEERGGRVMEV